MFRSTLDEALEKSRERWRYRVFEHSPRASRGRARFGAYGRYFIFPAREELVSSRKRRALAAHDFETSEIAAIREMSGT